MSSYYCRLCLLNSSPEECTIFSKTITDMLFYCIPEINVTLVNNPILCGNCKKSLEQLTEFKKKCIDVQHHIEKFKEMNLGSLDLSLISAASGLETPQSPVNQSFDDSYRKFIATSTGEITADSNDDEVSKIMNKAKEEIRKCDDFLDLLESSTNIKKSKTETALIIVKPPETKENFSFYNDTSESKTPKQNVRANNDSPKTVVSKTKNNNDPSKIVKKSSKPPSIETKRTITQHPISNPLQVKLNNNRCVTCDENFPDPYKLLSHLYIVHQKPEDVHYCLLCRYKVRSRKTVKRHFLLMHKDCITIHGSCPVCPVHTADHQKLLKHIKAEHKDICTSDRFKCNLCSFRSKNFESFKRHFIQIHELICNYCLKEFETVELLNRHIRCHWIETTKKPPELKDPLEFVEVKIENIINGV